MEPVFATGWTGVDTAEEHIQVSQPLSRCSDRCKHGVFTKGDEFVEFSNGGLQL